MRLVPLGINGFYPSFGRHTMSYLLLDEEGPWLLDAGTGVSRLGEPEIRKLVAPYDTLRILLSHYHLDHVAGLFYLVDLWPRGSIEIYAPQPPLVHAEPEAALTRLLSPPLVGKHYSEFPARVEVIPLSEGEQRIGGLTVRCWRQIHPGGSTGFRIEDVLAYATDTAPNPASVEHIRGAGLLLHELWMAGEIESGPDAAAHSHFNAVADLAKAAAVSSVMLVHHPPWRDNAGIREMTDQMQATGVSAVLPEEGRCYEL